MLSSSSIAFGYDLNLAAFDDHSLSPGIDGGRALLGFVDAVLGGDQPAVRRVQQDIIDTLGPESLVDAASVLGNFEMMNRVAEGTGIPVPQQAVDRMATEIEALGLDGFLKS